MTVRYEVRFNRQPRVPAKTTVPAVPMLSTVGHYDPESRVCLCADVAAVRSALPARLRKAFDRATVWYPGSGDIMRPAHAALRSTAGRYLGTLYLMPVLMEGMRHAA